MAAARAAVTIFGVRNPSKARRIVQALRDRYRESLNAALAARQPEVVDTVVEELATGGPCRRCWTGGSHQPHHSTNPITMAVSMRQSCSVRATACRRMVPAGLSRVSTVRVCAAAAPKVQIISPANGDPFIGFLETPVTSAPIVASYLSNLPAYRTAVAPALRGVEIGLAHGFLLAGPFIKLGPLRNVPEVAEIAGSLSAAGLVLILSLCLSIYGSAQFQSAPPLGVKTLSGRSVARDALFTTEGWSEFAAGFLVGGEAGVAWAYVCTQILPYYY
ncbi:Photosystem I reaction center subunit XI, chloroplastic [Tetrabaena socialis]|uniref:Photosystem I reaction center subunit XI, chloroplastic n=1 Tax=Tetrabaena socialis TaxID=47790 RepID=A0A2J8AD16_9CHLO|nr:Photosystem I reaction center subunit XI, chloroplastic [Tetrabaena socialis]|eukprot:PNH10410.1 Photosystem I reaction center subunit XI, chloroplastic [Tetrabaena socialis]